MNEDVEKSYQSLRKDKNSNDVGNEFFSFFKLFLIDLFLLNFSFFICYFVKYGSSKLSEPYFKLLFMFFLCWSITSIMAKKFKASSYIDYGNGVLVFFRSSLFLTYAIVFWVVVSGAVSYSRLLIFSTCITVFFSECLLWSLYNKMMSSRKIDQITLSNILKPFRFENQISYPLIVIDFFLVITSFFMINYIKRGQFGLLPNYSKLFMISIGLWCVVSIVTKKFSVRRYMTVHFLTWQWIKAGCLMLSTMSVLVFGLRLFEYSRFQSMGTILILLLMEVIIINFYYRISLGKEYDRDIESVEEVKTFFEQELISQDIDVDSIREKLMEPAREKFEKKIIPNNPDLFKFLDNYIALDDVMRMETAIEKSCELFDLNGDRLPVRLFLNQWKINDIRRINEYFLKVHKLLLPGGYYVGFAHTLHTHHDWINKKYPRYFAGLIYLLDFCFNRVVPKLPGLKKIYFSFTKGKNRTISRAEYLGRLSFCGFDIIAEKVIKHRLYVISRKAKTCSLDQNPTYGPIIHLKRIGIEGEVLDIIKFRTMHPYSEYLQQYVFNLQGLQKGGKLEQDFRLTAWGQWMRKLWIDELPMLYNWLRGDLQFVGVRPLSFQYYSLYDNELKELRKKVKPGLIPPFYADMPETFDEICDSEKRYIKVFLKHPIRTQCLYFWKAFVNILFKGARSN